MRKLSDDEAGNGMTLVLLGAIVVGLLVYIAANV